MFRATLGLLVAAACLPAVAPAATIGMTGLGSSEGGARISIQIDPADSPGRRTWTTSVRAQGAAGAEGFDATSILSPRSPQGACSSVSRSNNSNGECRDSLLSGSTSPAEDEFTLDLDNGTGETAADVWASVVPGLSDEEFVASQFGPKSDASVGTQSIAELIGGRRPIGEGNIGEVPEPSSALLLLSGAFVGLAYLQKRRR